MELHAGLPDEVSTVIDGESEGCIIQGDCLELLSLLPAGCVDAVVADPPYSSGGFTRGDRARKTDIKYVKPNTAVACRTEFTGDNRDQRSFLAWSSMWLGKCLRVSRPGAVAMIFSDWRQLPTMTDAVQCGGWVWRNIVTWWKPGRRMQKGRFSSSAEYIVYASSGVPAAGEFSKQNVLSFHPVNGPDKRHIAEKPLALMEELLSVTPADSLILDPFCGSGTTCAAAKKLGRRYIGMELDPDYCRIARNRLINTERPLFEVHT